MSNRSKSCDISPKVRDEVLNRDKQCVVCGSRSTLTIAHVFINRSHGGLGVKENLCVLCIKCHHDFDNGFKQDSERIKDLVQSYMHKLYEIDIQSLKYNKWR